MGIGRDLAREFAKHGHNVVLVARTQSKLDALAEELEERHGVTASVIRCDLARAGASEMLFRTVERRRLDVDILVNNAGGMCNGEFSEMSHADQQRMLALNVIAPTSLVEYFLPAMLARGRGRIMNVGSAAGFLPLPRLAVYSASKSYLLVFTEALSEELKGTGVTATALCPGLTKTDLLFSAPDTAKLPFPFDDPADVAREGYRACIDGTPVRVTGLATRVATELLRYQPRWLTRSISGFMARQRRA